ncbi:hypothetical protein D3C80_1960070 [compost metagenome]
MSRAGTPGLTTNTSGTVPTMEIWAKLLAMSNGTVLGISAALMVWLVNAPSISV